MSKALWFALLLLAVAAPGVVRGELLVNGGFESVTGSSTAQGILPNDWLDADDFSVGTDTYSSDGSYGLTPGAFGWFSGTTAHTGLRFVASYAFSASSVESFSQELSTPLTPGAGYNLSAYMLRNPSSNTTAGLAEGGYNIYLNDVSDFDGGEILLGSFAVSTGTGWAARELVFVAPGAAGSNPYLIFEAYSNTPATGSYMALDDVSLTLIPEPASAVLTGLLMAMALRRRPREV